MSFTFDFKKEHLQGLIGNNPYLDYWYDAMVQILPEYEINTPERVAAWLAQTAHESGYFKFLKENLNYRATSLRKVFGKYFPTDALAEDYASRPNKQEAIANRVYANRMGNGDEASGDGFRYLGRGLIQLTGKNNYTLFAASIDTPLEEIPEYLQTFEGAVQSACWFWDQNGLNRFADSRDIVTMSKRINGGTIGMEDRIMKYEKCLKMFGAADYTPEAPSADLNETVRLGSKGATVQAVQQALGIGADGDFGPGTDRALKAWQAANGLVADGIAGPNTLKRLLG
jgi:putative chitinase